MALHYLILRQHYCFCSRFARVLIQLFDYVALCVKCSTSHLALPGVCRPSAQRSRATGAKPHTHTNPANPAYYYFGAHTGLIVIIFVA